jgi:hypothetical protein
MNISEKRLVRACGKTVRADRREEVEEVKEVKEVKETEERRNLSAPWRCAVREEVLLLRGQSTQRAKIWA